MVQNIDMKIVLMKYDIEDSDFWIEGSQLEMPALPLFDMPAAHMIVYARNGGQEIGHVVASQPVINVAVRASDIGLDSLTNYLRDAAVSQDKRSFSEMADHIEAHAAGPGPAL